MGSPRLGWRGQEIKASPISGGEGLSCPKSPSQETRTEKGHLAWGRSWWQGRLFFLVCEEVRDEPDSQVGVQAHTSG